MDLVQVVACQNIQFCMDNLKTKWKRVNNLTFDRTVEQFAEICVLFWWFSEKCCVIFWVYWLVWLTLCKIYSINNLNPLWIHSFWLSKSKERCMQKWSSTLQSPQSCGWLRQGQSHHLTFQLSCVCTCVGSWLSE